jgi:hypothetical protein
MRLTLHEKRALAGKAGGTATLERHGLSHFQQIGHSGGIVGGRPKSLSLAELRAKKALKNINSEKGGGLEHRNSFIRNLILDLVQEANH